MAFARVVRQALAMLVMSQLLGCGALSHLPVGAAALPPPPPVVAGLTPSSRPPGPGADTAAARTVALGPLSTATTTRTGPLIQIFPAPPDQPPSPPRAVATDQTPGDISLNFANAEVKDVIRSVLGEALHLNFVIDPRVQGQITVQTNRPLQPDAALHLLADILHLYGIKLQRSSNVYLVAPQTDAGHGDRAAPPDAVSVLSLQFISPDEMATLMRTLVPGDPLVRPVPGRSVLLVGGASDEIARMADLVALFDVSAMSGMSFALFQPRFADARSLRSELTAILGSGGRNAAASARLLLIARLNAVLAVSRSPQTLRQLGVWVERLDQGAEADDDRLFIYHVQNGRAADLAAALGRIMGGGAAAGTGVDGRSPAARPIDEADPGAGAAASGAGGRAQAAETAGSAPLLTNAPAALTDPLPDAPPAAAGPTGAATTAARVSIVADEPNNALIVRATERDYRNISAALAKLDVAPLQVLIEAVVAEVTLTKDLRFGVQWYLRSGNLSATQSIDPGGAVAGTFPGLAAIYSAGGIHVALSALEALTTVKVVSSPSMLVMNNRTATLLVGDQVPIATQQAVSVTTAGAPVVNSIEYRDTGVILRVTPHVNEENLVRLEVSQEVSAVAQTTSSTLGSPAIQQRKFTSTISIRDGETIALGGIITDNREIDDTGVPVLKSLPVIGDLFKTTENKLARDELIVLMTPHVARNDNDLRIITRQLREQMSSLHE